MAVEFRPLKKSDITEFAELRASYFGSEGRREEINWLLENPFLDEPNVFVAVLDGQIIGGRGILPIPLKVGKKIIMGLQSSGMIVHPEHRGKGVFSQFNQYIDEYFAGTRPYIFFSFTRSEGVINGYKKHGLYKADISPYLKLDLDPRYDIDNMSSYVIGAAIAAPFYKIFSSITSKLYKFISNIRTEHITIYKTENPPIEILINLYNKEIPDKIHGIRTRDFYEWRFNHPLSDFSTYIAKMNNEPVMAITISKQKTTSNSLFSNVTIREIVPLHIPEKSRTILYSLLNHIIQNTEVDYYSTIEMPGGKKELLANGFLPQYINPKIDVIAPFIMSKYINNGTENIDLTEPGNWGLSLMERDH